MGHLRLNPMRSLRIAVVSQWVLAGLFLIPGMLMMVSILHRSRTELIGWTLANLTCLYLAPGILHVTCAIHLARRRLWAFTLAETLCAIYMLILVFVIVFGVLANVVSGILSGLAWGPIAFLVGSIALFVGFRWLSVILDDAVRVTGPGGERGFQPVMKSSVDLKMERHST